MSCHRGNLYLTHQVLGERCHGDLLRRLREGEGVQSSRPSDGKVRRGLQRIEDDGMKGDTTEEMGEMAEEWETWSKEMNLGAVAQDFAATAEADNLEPTYEEAKQRADWPKWKEAIQVELSNLKTAGTWVIVERPPDHNVVDCKWVFRIKKNSSGEIARWNARLVAKGFTQIYGVDYYETFAPCGETCLHPINSCNSGQEQLADRHVRFS